MNNMNSSRLTCIKMAGKELTKGFSNAKKAIKEAFKRPDRWQDSFVSKLVCSERYPEIDWFNETKWEDFDESNSFDTAAYPVQVNFQMSKYESSPSKSAHGIYTNTYTTFSGCDVVVAINGQIFGELQGIHKNLNGNYEGNIDLAHVRFMDDGVKPDNSLVVAVYMNEYNHAAYEVMHLNKMTAFKSGITMDMIQTTNYTRYHGKLLQPLTPMPDEIMNMTQAEFDAMLERVRKNCPHKEWLNLPEKPLNHVTNRTYVWVLDKYFCEKTEA